MYSMRGKRATSRAAFRICSRGGKIAVFAYQGGQALHAVQYNIIYSKISRGGKHPARGGGANAPPPALNETLTSACILPESFCFFTKSPIAMAWDGVDFVSKST